MTTNHVKNASHNASDMAKYGKAYINIYSFNIVGQNIISTLFIWFLILLWSNRIISLYCQAMSHMLSEPVFIVLYTAAKYNKWW